MQYMKEILVTRKNFKYVQSKGKQNLRFMILLYCLFLCLYSIIVYVLGVQLFHDQRSVVQFPILFHLGVMLSIWAFIMFQLWKYSRLGKMLFTIYAFVSFYFLKNIPVLFTTAHDMQEQVLCIILVSLCIGKNILGVLCMFRLYMDKTMRCIWNLYDIYENDLIQLDEKGNINTRNHGMDTQQDRKAETKLEKKAKTYLRIYTFLLVVYLYGSLSCIYLFMFLVRYYNPKAENGMEYVQRILLLSCLYTAFIWSLPLLGMFLYKRWTRVAILCMTMLEGGRFIVMLPQILKTFQTQHYLVISIVVFVGLEGLRYFLLFKIQYAIYRNVYISTYWSRRYQNILHRR